MDIAPLCGLRFDLHAPGGRDDRPEDRTAPPYDVIAPPEHARLLARSPFNIVRLTLGDEPGGGSSYEERARLLDDWVERGVLVRDAAPSFYVNEIDYRVPGEERRARLLALVALGRLEPLDRGVVLPHEETFPRVVEDRLRLLETTRANLESIFLLYSDEEQRIDEVLEAHAGGEPLVRVEARPGEFHALHRISPGPAAERLVELFRPRPVIIADGHHRYTTSLRFRDAGGAGIPGAGWRLMTLANLHGEGLSILATHRLVKLRSGDADAVVAELRERLPAAGPDDWEIEVKTSRASLRFSLPVALRAGRRGAAATSYRILHDVILGDWLKRFVGDEPGVSYFKEGTGEEAALAEGEGDLLFRLRPVGRDEFRRVVEGGELFPHKTTYFYPKLWSGLVLWRLEDA